MEPALERLRATARGSEWRNCSSCHSGSYRPARRARGAFPVSGIARGTAVFGAVAQLSAAPGGSGPRQKRLSFGSAY